MTSTPREEAPVTGTSLSLPSLKRVITSSALGQFIELYDFVIYAYSATILAHLFFPTDDPVAGVLSVFAVYAVGFAIRPVGAVVFGLLGDRIGRRAILVFVIVMMGVGTMAIGFLPTYEQVGLLAPILLIICRVIQGFSAAGESMTSNVFVAEHAPRSKRATYLSFTFSFTTLPSVVAALFVWGLMNGLGADVYESWAWRIPFLVGGPMALIGLYIRSKVAESPVFEAARATNEIAQQQNIVEPRSSVKRAVAYAFALCAVGAIGFYSLSGYMVSYLTTAVGLPQDQALLSNGIAMFVAFVSFWPGGYLADRFGRRPMVIGVLIGIVALYLPAFGLAATGTMFGAIAGQSIIGILLGLFFGVFGATILEGFPTRNRASGTVISYNVAYTVFGGTAPLVSTWLVAQSGILIAPAVYMVIIAALSLVAVLMLRMPETKGSSLLHADDRLATVGAQQVHN